MSDTPAISIPETPSQHPAQAVIVVGRVSGGSYLFGSEARHQHFIHLDIHRAEVERKLADDWVHPTEKLVEVYMTESQWAHFVSSMNLGGGTQCTLRYLVGEGSIPEMPQPKSKADQFEADLKATLADYESQMGHIRERINVMLVNGKAGKGDLNWLAHEMSILHGRLASNVGFVGQQFSENVEETLIKARQEIEAYFINRAIAVGLNPQTETPPLTLPAPLTLEEDIPAEADGFECPSCGSTYFSTMNPLGPKPYMRRCGDQFGLHCSWQGPAEDARPKRISDHDYDPGDHAYIDADHPCHADNCGEPLSRHTRIKSWVQEISTRLAEGDADAWNAVACTEHYYAPADGSCHKKHAERESC